MSDELTNENSGIQILKSNRSLRLAFAKILRECKKPKNQNKCDKFLDSMLIIYNRNDVL